MNILTIISADPIIALELLAIILCASHIIKASFYENRLEVKQNDINNFFRPHLIKI